MEQINQYLLFSRSQINQTIEEGYIYKANGVVSLLIGSFKLVH